jgi:DsbC/DsbD-like thiol-disulfide interchange protein
MKQEQFEQKTQQALGKQEEREQRQQQARSQLTPEELAWQNDLEEIQLVIIIILVASWGTYWYFSVHL